MGQIQKGVIHVHCSITLLQHFIQFKIKTDKIAMCISSITTSPI